MQFVLRHGVDVKNVDPKNEKCEKRVFMTKIKTLKALNIKR